MSLALEKPARLDEGQIGARLAKTPRLPSLARIQGALQELLGAENRYITQISDVIRRDPSMTTRLLRVANSVFHGLSSPVTSVEEAVFYLGLRQVRSLVVATPIVEEFQGLAGQAQFCWRSFWQHCIATGLLTNELIGTVQAPPDEMHYVGGLLHDVGKIVMAAAFPSHFDEIHQRVKTEGRSLREVERDVLGMDHCEIGAQYLKAHRIPDSVVQIARYHHEPEACPQPNQVVAVVQIADLLAQGAGASFGTAADEGVWESVTRASGWPLLFGAHTEQERSLAMAGLQRSLDRLPLILEGLV